MKTLKFFVLMLFVMFQSQTTYSFGIAIGNPCIQAAFPTPYFYPNGSISVNFRIDSLSIIDSKYALCMIYVVQRNVEVMMYSDVIEQGHNLSIPINPMNFPNLAYNETVKIKIEAVSARPPHLSSFNYAYAILYKPGMSVTYGSISNGTPQLINSGFATFYNSLDCHTLASSNYYVQHFKITFTLSGNFTNSIPIVDSNLCLGYNGAFPNFQERWGYKISQTDNEAKFITFVSRVINILGQDLGEWPCSIPQATIVYHNVTKPVIGSVNQYPTTITPHNNIGIFNCNLDQGNGNLSYEWRDSNNIHNHQFQCIGEDCRYLLITANLNGNENERQEWLSLHVRARNEAGYSEWKKYRVLFGSDPPHGCPQIETNAFDYNIIENPILNRSPGNPGKEVNDYFMFSNPLYKTNDSIVFSIKESENDITKINTVEMYQALVPDGNEFVMTDDGEPVNFTITPGKNKVTFNLKEDKTEELNEVDNNVVDLNKDDELNISFRDDNVSHYIVFRMRTNDKVLPAALITTSNDNVPREIYSRTNMSTSVLKVKPGNLNWVNLTARQNCQVDMVTVVPNENSFELKKLDLKSATNNNGSFSKEIFSIDKYYAVVQKDNPLKLIFQNNIRADKKSCYYTRITGSYTGNSNGDSSSSKNETEDKLEFKLYENTPNPFNPTTKIKFQIPESGLVKLTVYDISGREIKTLINDFRAEGNHEFNFDGSNFASGVYFYKLESGNFSDTKRMFLIK